MNVRARFFSAALLLSCRTLLAIDQVSHELPSTQLAPWFTGPLLAPSGNTVPAGHINIEPYLFYTVNNGNYDQEWHAHNTPNFYSTNVQLQLQFGIAKNLSFQLYPQLFYNRTQGEHYTNAGDTPIALNIQLFRPRVDDPWPFIKLSLKANLPTGKYQNLKSHLKRTDAIGLGSWFPGATLVFSKLWHISGIHFLEARLAANYQVGTPVRVKGLNTYGGAPNTRGTAYPGNQFYIDGSIQYSFTQRWVFACDLYYAHTDKNRFSGKEGNFPDGARGVQRAPSNEQWSLAPALEYNWSDSVGIIAGSWFTFAGRNAIRFASGVIAVNLYF